MAKKGELNADEIIDDEGNSDVSDTDDGGDEALEENNKKKKSAPGSKKKQVNIMDPANSNEPPPKKSKEETGPMDMAPVMEVIEKKFSELAESIKPKIDTPKVKKSDKKDDDELGFLAPFGNW